MKTYLSGPITGHPDGNQAAFQDAAAFVLARLEIPVNPHDVCYLMPRNSTWVAYMRKCISAMMECDRIVMLKGWRRSRGARIERQIAIWLKMEVEYETGASYGTFSKTVPAHLEEVDK